MEFLTPWSALFVAAVALPALVLLYLLKLRRQPLRIASTLLWEQAFEDLQANVPFQRLRYSLLLLIQFLLLAALLIAFAQPVLTGGVQPAGRIIVLIDVSASMRATDVDPNDPSQSRLDAARAEARNLIDNASRADRTAQIMIAMFGRSPRVITPFQSNRRILLDALDRVQPTDEQADLAQALRLAEAFATRSESDDQPPMVVLISDGGVGASERAAGFNLRAGRFRYVRVGQDMTTPVDNVGITAFTARRDFESPSRVDIFARLTNASRSAIELVATLRADDADPLPLIVNLPPATDATVGERSFTATMELPEGAVLSLEHNHEDALASDNTAALVLPAPRQPRLLMVHPDDDADADPFLVDLLRAADPAELIVMTASQYANQAVAQTDSSIDLIVFDRVSPAQLPMAPSLSFGAAPPTLGIIEPTQTGGQSVLSWDRQHPLMQYVELDAVRFAGFGGFDLPAAGTALAWGADGPIIALLRTQGVQHVAVGFELRRSDWPLHVSFAVFVQNVLEQLAVGGGAVDAFGFRPGEPITVVPKPGTTTIEVATPVALSVAVTNPGAVTLPAIRLAGVYGVVGAAPPFDTIAINVLSDQESDIRPVQSLRINAESAEAGVASDAAARPLWPYLIGAALVLVVLEWIAWCLRARM